MRPEMSCPHEDEQIGLSWEAGGLTLLVDSVIGNWGKAYLCSGLTKEKIQQVVLARHHSSETTRLVY